MKALLGIGALLGILATAVFSIVVLGLLKAYIAVDLYTWFLLPLGLPKIGLLTMYGIVLFIGLFKHSSPQAKLKGKEYEDKSTTNIALHILAMLIIWGLGYAVHLYI